MPIRSLFPTRLYEAVLRRAAAQSLNAELGKACLALAREDIAGRRWCKQNRYPGYTSYASLNDLTWRAPPFAALKEILDEHVALFARELQFDLGGQPLQLDSLWVNVLDAGGTHSGHIHPHSAISGTYYVGVPNGSGSLKLEDPRLPQMMAAPARKPTARTENRSFLYIEPKEGMILLWESWLRHEVMAGAGKAKRISISFNYSQA